MEAATSSLTSAWTDAWIGSIDISQKKAYTSRAFDIATKDLAAAIRSRAGSFSESTRPTTARS